MEYLITTPRLGLRRWQPKDLDPFAEMNADPAVREFFPNVMTREESAASMSRIENQFDKYGYGWYAVDLLATGEFIGFVGMSNPSGWDAWFMPCVEIGWRLTRKAWGHGYATEAAKACLDYAWNVLHLDKVYAYTAALNLRSQKVMDKIGMKMAGKFDHPKLEAGHPLQPHVVYEITRPV